LRRGPAMRGLSRRHSLYIPWGVVLWDMSLDSFFGIVYDMTIILAIVTFAMGFLYLYAGKREDES